MLKHKNLGVINTFGIMLLYIVCLKDCGETITTFIDSWCMKPFQIEDSKCQYVDIYIIAPPELILHSHTVNIFALLQFTLPYEVLLELLEL